MSSPKPKRPKTKAHHSSFIDRIHRRHDERHHPGEERHPQPSPGSQVSEAAPLLQDEHPDSDTEPQQEIPQVQPRRDSQTKAVKAAKEVANAIVGKMARALNTVRSGTFKTMETVKNNPKRSLAVACGVLAASTAGEAVDIYRHHPLPKGVTCMTPACVYAASRILLNLHPSVINDIYSVSQVIDPCENFDEYVCGGFKLQHELGEAQAEVSTSSIITEEVQSTLRRILEQAEGDVDEQDREIFKKAKDSYVACMDLEKLHEFALQPLIALTEEIKVLSSEDRAPLRKAPVLQAVTGISSRSTPFTAAFIHMMKMGIDALIQLKVEIDATLPDTKAVFIVPVRSIGLPLTRLYNNDAIVAEYQKIIASTLEHFYDTSGNASIILQHLSGIRFSINDLAQGVVNLEQKIAQIMPEEDYFEDFTKTHNERTYDELDELIPQLSIKSVVQELAPSAYNNSALIVSSPAYLQNLSSIMFITPNEVIQAFLVWKAIQEHAVRVEDDALNSWKQFLVKLDGRSFKVPNGRWRECVSSVNADLGWILSKFYVQDQFPQHEREFANEVVTHIRMSFRKLLDMSDWMDDEDHDLAVKRVDHINQQIGFPTNHPDVLDSSSIKTFYNSVIVHNNTYLKNKLSAVNDNLYRQWSSLGLPTDTTEWSTFSTDIRAYYNPFANGVVFPAAILRSPMFNDRTVPQYLTYGALGALTGHEVAHAVIPQTLQFNQNNTSAIRWSNSTQEMFESKAACFVDQYSQYTVDGPEGRIRIDGNYTMYENIADAGGINAANQAWTEAETTRASQLLPGLGMFSQEQLFWLSFGNTLCSKSTGYASIRQISADRYAPKSVRIKGTVFNSRKFRKAFNCPSKISVCEMW